MASTGPLDAEIAKVNALSRQMIDEYLAWGDKVRIGEIQNMIYGELTDFVNFRVETADTCLSLIENWRIADALGLCRSLLENYLLLMLMCRGRKYFQLQDVTSKTDGQFKTFLKEQQTKLAEQHANSEALACLEVRSYPRAKRHLMYIFEGLTDKEDPGFFIPLHYFQFQEFSPETMRLKDDDYFSYYEPEPEVTKARKGFQEAETFRYRHYLSYDALIQCLAINGLVNAASQARLEAHYTFLGKFLHPTHEAARSLHEQSNVHIGRPAIGMGQTYSKTAALLAALYVAYCLAGLFDEITGLLESAPPKYIADPGTASLRQLTARVPKEFPYFWFLFNDAPLYDKFNYAIHHVSDEDLAKYGHYSNVPSDLVTFDQHIYGHLQSALGGWSNGRCGVYRSPLGP